MAAIPDEAGLERIIEKLPSRPFLAGEDGVTMRLAGAREKLPVALIDGEPLRFWGVRGAALINVAMRWGLHA